MPRYYFGGEAVAKEFAKPFYKSDRWQRCRYAYIKSVNGLCEECMTKGKITPGYIVHHKVELDEININDPYVTLGWDNLQYVCHECHNKIHFGESEVLRDGMYFDENGEMMQETSDYSIPPI